MKKAKSLVQKYGLERDFDHTYCVRLIPKNSNVFKFFVMYLKFLDNQNIDSKFEDKHYISK